MGDLSEDLERCLCDCACDAQATARAKTSCSEGRVRETKRILLGERQRLLAELHASQRGIDTIDHILYRVSCECVPARLGSSTSITTWRVRAMPWQWSIIATLRSTPAIAWRAAIATAGARSGYRRPRAWPRSPGTLGSRPSGFTAPRGRLGAIVAGRTRLLRDGHMLEFPALRRGSRSLWRPAILTVRGCAARSPRRGRAAACLPL